MRITQIPSSTYVVAVSGGVDSVVLLDVLASRHDLKLIVAHFDHGIRPDSTDDAQFVENLTKQYGLPFVSARQALGPDASEATARQARYAFLRRVQHERGALAIVTAHHQDDVLETTIINLMRGTGWRGLASLRDTATLRRPLLNTSKQEILEYAREYKLEWREDSSNASLRYLRNRIRHQILPAADTDFRREMLALIARQGELRREIEKLIQTLTHTLSTSAQESLSPMATVSYSAEVGECVDGCDSDCGNPEYSDQLVELPRAIPQPGKARTSEGSRQLGSVSGGLSVINRPKLNLLPNVVAKELLLEAVFGLTGRRVERAMLARILWFVRTARPHKTLQVSGFLEVDVSKTTVVVRVK